MARPAVPTLIRSTSDSSSWVREYAILALMKIKIPVKKMVPLLLKALKDKDEEVRESAALSLGRIGPKAGIAFYPLLKALKDKDWRVRARTIEALALIAPKAKKRLRKEIKKYLSDKHFLVRSAAIRTLNNLKDRIKTPNNRGYIIVHHPPKR